MARVPAALLVSVGQAEQKEIVEGMTFLVALEKADNTGSGRTGVGGAKPPSFGEPGTLPAAPARLLSWAVAVLGDHPER